MTKSFKEADKVIKKFGGIRPLARALDVTASTVQGWKKRNTIPDDRTASILKAAEDNGIDLSSLTAATSNSNQPNKENVIKAVKLDDDLVADIAVDRPKVKTEPKAQKKKPIPVEEAPTYQGEAAQIYTKGFHTQNVRHTLIGGTALAVSILALAAALFSPNEAPRQANLQASFDGLEDLRTGLAVTTRNTEEYRRTAQDLYDRVAILEQNPRVELSPAPAFDAQAVAILQEQIDSVRTLLEGNQSYKDLLGRFAGFEASLDSLEAEIQAVQNVATQNQFGATDLKATAMLVALSQTRAMIGRDTDFSDDLALLKQLVGADKDAELADAFDKLAPHAESGILSRDALRTELDALTTEIIEATLRGEDLSFFERVQARFSRLVRITKDGAPVSTLRVDGALLEAQQSLDTDDLDTAIETLRTLNPQALRVLQPWFDHAQGLQASQLLQNLLRARLNTIALETQQPPFAADGPIFIPSEATLELSDTPPETPAIEAAPDVPATIEPQTPPIQPAQ